MIKLKLYKKKKYKINKIYLCISKILIPLTLSLSLYIYI